MECPYCKKQMKPGSIDVYDTLSWSPEGEDRRGSTRYSVADDSVVLAKYPLFFPASKEAYYCSQCKKIIINVE